ncbi:gluconate 2-dehydrogenase subunit 3 family protein [Telluribacter humicola]|uniref:gluconate 2-dehydrogenase subunit 3 family protein n=1 Tax=Telluribacter humicola TaxID=1720261 RepID=UPI001A960E3E|nr:gluconate 2-dehydrogenase subunit 3 family protein [Telluribacter humicola]
MKRRSAIKSLGLALGGLVSLPAWASNWTPESVGPATALSTGEEALLAELVEAIIPRTTNAAGVVSPGAKELGVHQFAARMIRDCLGEPAQASLKEGLVSTDKLSNQTYQKGFAALTPKEKVAVLTSMSNSADATTKGFVSMIKNLTIRGYTNSEYYMTQVLKYNMAPGYYHGCVPVVQ